MNKYRCINEDWEDLFILTLKSIPNKSEIVFHNNKYYEIGNIIHSEKTNAILILIDYEKFN